MRVCKNENCKKEFEPTNSRHMYCTPQCAVRAYDVAVIKDPVRLVARREQKRLARIAREKKNPAEAKRRKKLDNQKRSAKAYINGDLPPWMFT